MNENNAKAPRPQPPREPEPHECCQSGCDPCIYDLYWERLARYEAELAAWEAAQHGDDGSGTARPSESST